MQRDLTVMKNSNTAIGWQIFVPPWTKDNGPWNVSDVSGQKRSRVKAYVPTA